jgi:hypothetical protein
MSADNMMDVAMPLRSEQSFPEVEEGMEILAARKCYKQQLQAKLTEALNTSLMPGADTRKTMHAITVLQTELDHFKEPGELDYEVYSFDQEHLVIADQANGSHPSGEESLLSPDKFASLLAFVTEDGTVQLPTDSTTSGYTSSSTSSATSSATSSSTASTVSSTASRTVSRTASPASNTTPSTTSRDQVTLVGFKTALSTRNICQDLLRCLPPPHPESSFFSADHKLYIIVQQYALALRLQHVYAHWRRLSAEDWIAEVSLLIEAKDNPSNNLDTCPALRKVLNGVRAMMRKYKSADTAGKRGMRGVIQMKSWKALRQYAQGWILQLEGILRDLLTEDGQEWYRACAIVEQIVADDCREKRALSLRDLPGFEQKLKALSRSSEDGFRWTD